MVAHKQFPYSFLLLLLCFSHAAPCYCLLFCLLVSISTSAGVGLLVQGCTSRTACPGDDLPPFAGGRLQYLRETCHTPRALQLSCRCGMPTRHSAARRNLRAQPRCHTWPGGSRRARGGAASSHRAGSWLPTGRELLPVAAAPRGRGPRPSSRCSQRGAGRLGRRHATQWA